MLPVESPDRAADGMVNSAVILKAGFFFRRVNVKVYTGRLDC